MLKLEARSIADKRAVQSRRMKGGDRKTLKYPSLFSSFVSNINFRNNITSSGTVFSSSYGKETVLLPKSLLISTILRKSWKEKYPSISFNTTEAHSTP